MSSQKVVVFGYNKLSYSAAGRLRAGDYQILIVDSDEQRLEQAKNEGFDIAAIDFRSDEALYEIGIGGDIKMIFCFLPEDSENVFLTISARSMDKDLTIISIVKNPESADKFLAAGADKIINPYEVCGRKIYELIKRPVITDILDHTVFGRHDLNMVEVGIPAGSRLENTLLSDLELSHQYNLILIGVVDKALGNELFFATGGSEHTLDAGDILLILGSEKEISTFKNDI